MCDMAHVAGLVAAKVIPSLIPYMDFVTSSTTKPSAPLVPEWYFVKKNMRNCWIKVRSRAAWVRFI